MIALAVCVVAVLAVWLGLALILVALDVRQDRRRHERQVTR